MNVLVLESDPGAADAAISRLESEGHSVLRCHEPGEKAFPCSAVLPGGSCPIEREHVDVALTVRAHPRSMPSALEDGVSCALRARIPVVVAGSTSLEPFGALGATVVPGDEDLVRACERAATEMRPEHSRVATEVVQAVFDNAGMSGRGEAIVHSSRDGLVARLVIPANTPNAVRDTAAVRVAGALRRYDTSAARVDVTLVS